MVTLTHTASLYSNEPTSLYVVWMPTCLSSLANTLQY